MKHWIIGSAFTVLLSANGAWAADVFYTGNQMLERCNSELVSARDFCTGFVAGSLDAPNIWASWGMFDQVICFPDGTPLGQLRKVFVKHMEENPEKLHLAAASLSNNAFALAFPCEG